MGSFLIKFVKLHSYKESYVGNLRKFEYLTSILDIRVTRELQFNYSSSRHERTHIFKGYLLSGFFLVVFVTQELLIRASVRELVFHIFCYNQSLQL